MKRIVHKPRKDWQKKLEEKGCFYHTPDNETYWQDDAAYELTAKEVEQLENAGNELHEMCLHVADQIITSGDYHAYNFPKEVIQLIETSWNNDEWELYGRFDLGFDGFNIKLFEYNADTPTTLPEASVWQWHALEDRKWPDQFNSIHEGLVERWKDILATNPHPIYFTTSKDASHEDWGNLHYIMETAAEAGFTKLTSIDIEQIGWSEGDGFVDQQNLLITNIFKLYPWEWLMADEFGWHIHKCNTRFIEPAWKMLLSNKTLLAMLWKTFPEHPLLLEAHLEDENKSTYIQSGKWLRKPVLGREGINISPANVDYGVDPAYNKHGYVIQRKFNVPAFSGQYPTMGVWIIGNEAKGLGIREDNKDIATNASRFVPHYFK